MPTKAKKTAAPPADDNTSVFDPTPTDTPSVPATEPPGDFTTGSFWASPSTWITITTYLLPILTAVFHRDFSAQAKAIAQIAPMIATGVLLLARNLHKREVIRANLHLASLRLEHNAALQREVTIALANKLTAAQAHKLLSSGDTIRLPVGA